MKQEEKEVLVVNKIKEKKPTSQIYEEIETLRLSQIKFKRQTSEIKSIKKQIEILEREKAELKKKNFNLNLRLNSIYKEERDKKIENGNGQIKYVERILLILKSENRAMNISELSKYCCTDITSLKICINFMKKYNLIEEIKESGVSKYTTKYE